MNWEELKEKPEWIFGGILALGLLVASKASASGSSVDALTRMLIAETGFNSGEQEMAQIVFLALNRSKRWGLSIASVVAPGRSVGGGRAWNAQGTLYTTRYLNAPRSPRWAEARAFVQRVLRGDFVNRGYMQFLHPGGMSMPPCVSPKRVEVDTFAGRRCLPTEYATGAPTVVGQGLFV